MRAQQGSFVLKHQNRRRKQAAFENPDFAEALYGASSDRFHQVGRENERHVSSVGRSSGHSTWRSQIAMPTMA